MASCAEDFGDLRVQVFAFRLVTFNPAGDFPQSLHRSTQPLQRVLALVIARSFAGERTVPAGRVSSGHY